MRFLDALYGLPYSVAYAEQTTRAFALLNEAADLLRRNDDEFAGFLRNRLIGRTRGYDGDDAL